MIDRRLVGVLELENDCAGMPGRLVGQLLIRTTRRTLHITTHHLYRDESLMIEARFLPVRERTPRLALLPA